MNLNHHTRRRRAARFAVVATVTAVYPEGPGFFDGVSWTSRYRLTRSGTAI